jgi:cellulose synthase/poly-beta-1,6-N-acetylglucosamine synthase-like glycosyltransferase
MLSSMGALYVTPGPFSIFRTQVFRELGGYRYAHMTEDMEMAMRMQKNRYKIVNSHGAHVYTVTPSTLRGLVKQRARWTYGFLNNGIDYKEMFFNKKYGNIGLFILPIATFSIFSALFMVSNVIYGWGVRITQIVHRIQAVGFNWKFSTPSFDWYFINTGTLPIIIISAVGITLFTLYLSLRMADGKFKFHRGILYYLFLYTFMVPLWLIKALFDTIFKRKVSWR